MHKYLLNRIFQAAVLLFIVSIFMFVLLRLAPGGPAILAGEDLTAEAAEQIRRNLGLDQPLYKQYLSWAGNILQGDAGISFSNSRPVSTLISQRFGPTVLLASAALFLAILISVPLGVISAIKRNSWIDRIATAFAFLGVSIPNFWLGIMLMIFFSVTLAWLPSGGMARGTASIVTHAKHLILPAFVLGVASMAQLTRFTRSAMIDAIRQDYTRTAHAKGLAPRVVINKHALRNGLIPVVTMLGVIMPRLFSGAAITESIFSWPGLGRLAVDSAMQRDYPVIMALTLVVSALVITASLVVDVAYVLIDPRIKYD